LFKLTLSYVKYLVLKIKKDTKEYSLGRDGNNLSIESLMKEFHGKRIWNRESKRDWLIWSNELYASNLIIIGGFEGSSARIFSERVNTVKKAHIYEPVPQFYGITSEK
jgi:hypothetical protein